MVTVVTVGTVRGLGCGARGQGAALSKLFSMIM
jgi:hypothetical protein